MTDRLVGFTIVLVKSIREDDAEKIKEALGMIKGVASVESVVEGSESFIAESKTKNEIRMKLLEFVNQI